MKKIILCLIFLTLVFSGCFEEDISNHAATAPAPP